MNYTVAPTDKSNMAKYLFAGFTTCLHSVQKFDTDAERRLAGVLECDVLRWFKPARDQFRLFYRDGADHAAYQPDFVAETADTILMLEPKASNQLNDPIVLAKRDVIAENMTLAGLATRYRWPPH